ncbi:MAG: hypothetical protein HY961_04595 [Ignavibacteriae bacterium]|nr:hypothetical protein [Ignavibacteriota bacterium]
MRYTTLFVLVHLLLSQQAFAQTRNQHVQTFTDKGHWLGFKVGFIASEEPLGDRWIISGMYEFRFSKIWSLPFEGTLYRIVRNTWDGRENFRSVRQPLALSVALKLRIPLGRPSTNVSLQGGIGSGSFYPVVHYAIGMEYGITERLTLVGQVRRHSLDINEPILSVGLNFDVTSMSLKQKYLITN